jgi:hypothetical protein
MAIDLKRSPRGTMLCGHIRAPLALWLLLQPDAIDKSILRKHKAKRKGTHVGKKQATGVTFDDVAGIDEARAERMDRIPI